MRFCPAQDEWRDQAAQPQARAGRRPLVLILFDRSRKAQVKLVESAQQARVNKTEQVPQFAQMVFQRRAAGQHAEVPLQGHHGLRALGGAILDRLRFVEHDRMPAHAGKHGGFLLQQAIAGHHHVEGLQGVEHVGPVAAAEQFDVQGRREALRLADPVHAHGRGRDDEGGTVRCARQNQCQRLQGLAESHVVGQAGAHAPVRQTRQPLVAGQLVVAQVGLQSAGQLRRKVVEGAQAQQVLAPQFVGLDAARIVGQLFQRKRGQRVDVHAIGMRFAIRGQLGQAAVQFVAEREELVVAQGHEAALIVLHQVEQGAQIHHLVFIDLHLAAGGKPVFFTLDIQAHLAAVDAFRHAHGFAFGPRQDQPGGVERLQLDQQLQAQRGLAQQPLAMLFFRLFQHQAITNELALRFAFPVQVAPRLHGTARHVGKHAFGAAARCVIGAVVVQRAHQNLHL